LTVRTVLVIDDGRRRMNVIALNPGVTGRQVQDNTGFVLGFDDEAGVTEPPTDHELAILRELDPDRLYIA